MKLWVCKKRDGMEWMGVPQVLWRSTLLSCGRRRPAKKRDWTSSSKESAALPSSKCRVM